jgi:hypothetical protein
MLMNIDVERDELNLDRDDEVTHGRCQILTGASANPGIRRKSQVECQCTSWPLRLVQLERSCLRLVCQCCVQQPNLRDTGGL